MAPGETVQPPLARLFGRRSECCSAVVHSQVVYPQKVQTGPELIVKANNPSGPSPYRIMPQPRPMPMQVQEVGAPVLQEEVVPIAQVDHHSEPQIIESQPMPRFNKVESTPASARWDRRTFNDLTAHPAFAHDKGYRWLIGVVQQQRGSRAWEIRYASAEEDDVYDGHLPLVPAGPVPDLQNGQLVRVEGHVQDRAGQPTYHAQSIRAMFTQP
jgi:hypothetical protein